MHIPCEFSTTVEYSRVNNLSHQSTELKNFRSKADGKPVCSQRATLRED